MDKFKTLNLFEDNKSDEESNEEITIQTVQNHTAKEKTLDAEISNEEQESSGEEQIESLMKLCQQLSRQISSMEELFKKRIRYTDYEEKIVSQMHIELQKYKDDLYSQMICPIFADVIEVREFILNKTAEYYQNAGNDSEDFLKKNFDYLSELLKNVLEKNNVEIYQSECGELFDPKKHRIVKKEKTDDQTLHGKIVKRKSCGYRYCGKVIYTEKVMVYSYDHTKNIKNESEDK